MSGRVTLLGAGPGNPELLTLIGKRRLGEADVVLYDRLIDPPLLSFTNDFTISITTYVSNIFPLIALLSKVFASEYPAK